MLTLSSGRTPGQPNNRGFSVPVPVTRETPIKQSRMLNFCSSILSVGEVQVACYRILNALYTLATKGATFAASSKVLKEELERHLPALGRSELMSKVKKESKLI